MSHDDTDEIDVLRHSLGTSTSRSGAEYRNYYAGEPDDATCLALVAKGDMRIGRRYLDGLILFHVTEQGKTRARSVVPA